MKFLISIIRFLIPIKLKIFFLKKNYIYNSLIYRVLGLSLIKKKLNKCGLKVKNISMISTKQIFFSNPIVCEMIKSNKKTILNYSKKNKFNLKIINSIHYDLIKKIDNKSKNFFFSKYVLWQKFLHRKRINNRNKIFIQNKILKVKKIYESIKKFGQIVNDVNKLPIIISKPLLKTRYGHNFKFNQKSYFEVYDGHHRLAVLKYLNIKKVLILLCEDVAVSTPFGVKLSKLTF
jgi:hypothetical protein